MKEKFEKPVQVEDGDTFKVVLSKYGAIALEKQESLSQLIGETPGDLDIENGTLSFGDITVPIQIIGFHDADAKQWSWAWDNEEIFGKNLIKSAVQMKAIGDEFDIPEFNTPVINTDISDCHTLSMCTIGILKMDAYYAVSEEGLDIFVAIESDLIKEDNSLLNFRNTFYNFQKNFKIYPKIAFESYTKLKGYGYKPHDEFAVAKIRESRIIVGFTERGNVTRILMYDEEE